MTPYGRRTALGERDEGVPLRGVVLGDPQPPAAQYKGTTPPHIRTLIIALG